MNRTTAALAALALLAACSKGPAPAPAQGAAAGSPPGASASPATSSPAHVSAVTTLRREPTDAPRVKGTGKKELPNQLALLLRGEKVTVLEAREDWARVRTSDDAEGWLHRATLLEGEGISEATVLAPADVFDRPDLLAANARRKVEPGTLLLVVKAKPPFSEVNVSSGPNAWVLSERLATGVPEVSVAKLAEKARWLRKAGREDEARQILALARQSFPGVSLVDALAVELGEAPSTTAVVPTSTTAPIDPTKP
ncbi:MAG TPA: SH3 domain-containing protein [Anaeromyxobacter sp.]